MAWFECRPLTTNCDRRRLLARELLRGAAPFLLGLTLLAGCGGRHVSLVPSTSSTVQSVPGQPASLAPSGLPSHRLTSAEATRLVSPNTDSASRKRIVATLTGLNLRGISASDYEHNRIAIILPETKEILYNDPAMAGTIISAGSGDRAERSSVPRHIMAPDPISTTTGPVRRIWSNSHMASLFGQPFGTYAYGTVDIPCRNGNLRTGDSGQIYMGGSSPGSGGASIDAGLQYNYSAVNHPNDDYGLYIRSTRNTSNSGYFEPGSFAYYASPGQWASQQKVTFPCGQSVSLQFSLDNVAPTSLYGSPNVTMVISAQSSAFSEWFVVIFPNTDNYYGWNSACAGCNLKRATSIAQNAPTASSPLSYDFFHTTWQKVKISCGFNGGTCPVPPTDPDWDASVTLGCDEYPFWDGGYSLGDCHNSPSGAPVSVTSFGYNFENVTIEYNPPPASGIGVTTGNTNTPGLTYKATVSASPSDLAFDLVLNNTTSQPMTIEFPNSCPAVRWGATGEINGIINEYFSYPSTGISCLQSLEFSTLPANAVYDLGSVHWTGSHTSQVYYWNASVPALGIYTTTGAVTTLSVPAVDGTSYMPGYVPAPTPTPERTAPPCLRQPCPQ